MRGLFALLLILLAPAAQATQDGWPALYDVTGVAQNDVLNIRAAPSASAPIVGSLRPTAQDVEVIGPNDALTWGQVNSDGRSGWVSLRYLSRQPGQWDGSIPAIRQCFGTEPFWSFRGRPGASGTWSTPEEEEEITLNEGTGSLNHRGRFAFRGTLGGDEIVLAARKAQCSDGMSDRLYGIAVDLLQLGNDGTGTLYSGCCSIAP
ncbi:MAG: SH3 domain-containing protein [Sulfitobacter sp.]|nr:SH3 domain-containing protein [Sulfitobacter sp.]